MIEDRKGGDKKIWQASYLCLISRWHLYSLQFNVLSYGTVWCHHCQIRFFKKTWTPKVLCRISWISNLVTVCGPTPPRSKHRTGKSHIHTSPDRLYVFQFTVCVLSVNLVGFSILREDDDDYSEVSDWDSWLQWLDSEIRSYEHVQAHVSVWLNFSLECYVMEFSRRC